MKTCAIFGESKHTVTLPTYFRGSGSLNPQDLRRWCVQARTWVNYAAREMNGRRFFSDCCSRLRFFDEKVRHALRLGDGIRALASSGGGGGAVTSSRTVGRRRPRRSVALRNRRLENKHQHTHTQTRTYTHTQFQLPFFQTNVLSCLCKIFFGINSYIKIVQYNSQNASVH